MSVGSDIADELLKGPTAPPAPSSGGVGASVADQMLNSFPQSISSGPGPDRTKSQSDFADDSKKALPLMTILKGSAFPDVEKKLDFYSQETGIPRARWGVVDGNIVYADPQSNQYYRAEPSVVNSKDVMDAWQRATKWMASQVGPSVPGVAGGVVGAAMGPTGMSIPAAGATAGVVDLARQGIGNLMLDGDQGFDVDLGNAAGQAALAMGGQAIPTALIRGASRNPMKISPYDRSQAMDPATLAAAQQAQQEAQGQGVGLTFGQATNLRSGRSGERQLAKDPASMDTMDKFYQGQREQVGTAASKFTDSVSPVQSVDEGVKSMREGAEAAVRTADDARKAVASPLYQKALENEERFWIPALDPIMERPSVRKGIAYAKLIAKEEGRDITVPVYDKGKVVGRDVVPDWRSWDYIKRGIDRVIEENVDDFGKMTAYGRSVVQTKGALLGILDKANPEYATARKAFETASPDVTALKQSAVGTLATKDGTERIGEIRTLFNANLSNPAAVGKARAAFVKAGQEDQWNAGVATYLRDALDAASKTDKGLSAQRLVTAVYGDERQKALLKEAMTPDQFDGFTRLMNVVQHVARTLPEGSPTATDVVGGQALRAQFGKPVKMAKDALNMNFGDALFDRATLRMSDSGMEKLAKAVTDPNNVEQLKKLRMLDPRHEKAVIAASQLFGITAVGSTGLRDPSDRAPKIEGPTTP